MRLIINAITLLVIGLIIGSIAAVALSWPFFNLAQGELRCESHGAVVIRVAGQDYAVNGLAGVHVIHPYSAFGAAPLIQKLTSKALSSEGLTLCDW